MTVDLHEETRRAIERHFGRGNPADAEHAMFGHISGCDSCRSVYDHYAVLTDLVPGAPSRQDRLMRGLAKQGRTAVEARRWVLGAALAAGVASLLLFVVPWGQLSEQQEFRARGAVQSSGPELLIYDLAGGDAKEVDEAIGASDALAFAYANPGDAPYLMVFAIGADSRVHWYYPAWMSADDDPVAVPIAGGSGVHELSEGIRHEYATGPLEVVALFTERAWHVSEIEAAAAEERLAELEQTELVSRTLNVQRAAQ